MCAADRVTIEVGERVLEALGRGRFSSLGLAIQDAPPEVRVSFYLTTIRLRPAGWEPEGVLTFRPLGAAGLLARGFGGAVPGDDRFWVEKGLLHVRPLPAGLPAGLKVAGVELGNGSIRIVLKRDINP